MSEHKRVWGRPDPMADPPSPSRLWNLPNALTMLRLLLVPLFGYLLLLDSGQSDTARWWAAVVFVVASLTDLADGAIARARAISSSERLIFVPFVSLTTGQFRSRVESLFCVSHFRKRG